MADDSDVDNEGGLMNYKGIYFNDDPNSKYTCPQTGAHFEFNDMCGRLGDIIKWRKIYEQKIAAYTNAGKGHNGIAQVIVHEDEMKVVTAKDRKDQLRVEKEEFMRKMGVEAAKKKKIAQQQQQQQPAPAPPAAAQLNQQQQQASHHQKALSQAKQNPNNQVTVHRRHANHSQERVQESSQKQIIHPPRTKQGMVQALQEKRMKTSDSYEMLTNQMSDQSQFPMMTSGQPSKLSNQQKLRGFRDSQDSNQRSQILIGEKQGSQMGTNIKDASILTNYQQKQMQALEQQSNKSIKNLSGLRSKSIDKTSANGGVQKFYQGQVIQQASGQMVKKQNTTMYNGLVTGGVIPSGVNQGQQQKNLMGTTLQQNQKGSQLSGMSQKRTNNGQIRKRVTSDVQMIAIAQAQNNAVNTAEDSVSPNRVVPHLAKAGLAKQHQQMRIDQASRQTTDDIAKLMKAQNGRAQGPLVQSSKQRGRPQFGLAQVDSNFTGIYAHNDLSSVQYQRRVGTQDVRPQEVGSFSKGLQGTNSYHQSINSNRNLTRSSNRSNRQHQREHSSKSKGTNNISSANKGQHHQINSFYQHQQNQSQMSDGTNNDPTSQTTIITQHAPGAFHGKKMSYKKSQGGQMPHLPGQFLAPNQVPIRQLIPSDQNSGQTTSTGVKSRNPGAGKGQLRGGNSHGANKNGSFGAMSSKSPVMAKSFAIPNNQGYSNQPTGKAKQGSIGFQNRMSDFDNPMASNTVDFTHLGNNSAMAQNAPTNVSQKDNQMMYKMMFQGGAGRQQKNLASSYLRGIDNQLRQGKPSNSQNQNNGTKQSASMTGGTQKRTLQNNKVVLAGIKMDGGSSRNKPMVAPSGTQKTRSFGNGKLLNGSIDLRKSYY